jgi:hypothetical protein
MSKESMTLTATVVDSGSVILKLEEMTVIDTESDIVKKNIDIDKGKKTQSATPMA